MGKHKNGNDAVGNYGIYQIMIDDVIYKINKFSYSNSSASPKTTQKICQTKRLLYPFGRTFRFDNFTR